LTEKAELDFEIKKIKKEAFMEHSAAANPPPKALTQKAQRRRVCGSTNVLRHQKKDIRTSFKRKEVLKEKNTI
jgi:hypothetical protein